jgi:hypothetical protein
MVIASLILFVRQLLIGRNSASLRPQQTKWRGGKGDQVGPQVLSPLPYVLTFPTTVGDHKERNVSWTYCHSLISFCSAT